jgi:UDP-glucose 4-epimerase
VFGRDYDTPDGTCIRDYIHILDLAEAHWLALQYLQSGKDSSAFNLGNGNGYSVESVLQSAQRVTGKTISVQEGQRRQGDPARLVANAAKIKQQLGWRPAYADLDTLVEHAWRWECKRTLKQ